MIQQIAIMTVKAVKKDKGSILIAVVLIRNVKVIKIDISYFFFFLFENINV